MLNKNFIEETNEYASQLICNIFLKSYSLDQFYDEGCKIIDMQKTLITTYRHHQHAENFSKTCKALCTAISFLIKRIETITDHKYECDSIEYKNQMSKALTLGESCSVDFLDDIAIKSLKETIERLKKKVGFIFETPPSLSVARTSNKINIGSPYIVVYSFNRPVPCTISVKEDGFSIKSCGTPKIDIDKVSADKVGVESDKKVDVKFKEIINKRFEENGHLKYTLVYVPEGNKTDEYSYYGNIIHFSPKSNLKNQLE